MTVSLRFAAILTLVIGSSILRLGLFHIIVLSHASVMSHCLERSSLRYTDILSRHSVISREQNSENIISDKNDKRFSIEPERVGSIARVPRLVDTARTPPRVSLDDDIVHRETGFRSIFFCCPSATAL